nr:putative late blight resistance protein homolog R1A-10 [Ipomoea batatas]
MDFVLITSLLNILERSYYQIYLFSGYREIVMIESLRDKIRNLQAFLEDSQNNNISKRTIRRALESEIGGVARDAEDKIESELQNLIMSKNSKITPPKKAESLYKTLKQVNRNITSIEGRIQIESKNNHSAPEPQRIENIKVGSFSKRSSEPTETFIVETIGPNAPGEDWKSPSHMLDNMLHLRHVMFSKSSLYLPRQDQTTLQTISCLYYRPEPWPSIQNFTNIPNVKKLGIYIDITPVSDPKLSPSHQHSSLNDLVDLQWLENLKIDVPEIIPFQDVFRLPTSFPSNLKKLTLQGTCLPWDDMAIIATLPNLEALKLKHKAFCGSEWKTTENGFCKLKYLKIAVLDFEHWSAYFPVLECLILDFCRKLKKFPTEFADITTLQLIELTRCGSSLVTSAKQIHEEQLECLGYTKLVIHDYCTLF